MAKATIRADRDEHGSVDLTDWSLESLDDFSEGIESAFGPVFAEQMKPILLKVLQEVLNCAIEDGITGVFCTREGDESYLPTGKIYFELPIGQDWMSGFGGHPAFEFDLRDISGGDPDEDVAALLRKLADYYDPKIPRAPDPEPSSPDDTPPKTPTASVLFSVQDLPHVEHDQDKVNVAGGG